MRILSVKQKKPIQRSENGFVFPLSSQTKINLDKKNPSRRKEHQLIFQQGRQYGAVGDCCNYLDNDELLSLEEKGMIEIKKSK